MKKFYSNWLVMSLVLALAFLNACTKDEPVVQPKFPDKQTISIKANETKEFTFDANMDWKLTSSQTWCVFVVNGAEEFSLSGKAGKQTVTIKVTDENVEFDETKAVLKLQMGSLTEDIAEIIRSAKDFDLLVFDAEGNEVEFIEVGYDDFIQFSVEANFDFAATEKPEWVEFDGGAVTGSANQKVTGGAVIVKDGSREKYPVEAGNEHVIVFANEAGTASFTIPVSFAGMDPNEIDITVNTAWHWQVDMEGKNFIQKSQSDDAPEYKNAVPFNIAVLNDDYKVVYAELSNDQYWLTDENGENVSWLKLVDKEGKGSVTVEVEEFTPQMWGPKERTGTILVFPAAVYEAAVAELEDGTDYDQFANKYEENILIEITQKEASSGFIILRSGWLEVAAREETDTEILNLLKYDLGVEEVFAFDADEDTYFSINPELEMFGEDEGETLGMFYAITPTGEDIDPEDIGLAIGGMSEDGFFYLDLITPSPFNTPIILVVVDGTYMNKKALVVYPN